MLDKIEMRIPVDASLVDVREDGKYCIFGFDLLDLSIRFDALEVYKDEEGEKHHQILRHPYSRLPTSYTKMAFKFVHEGCNWPYVELKCSPAKILQGHNVFGSDLIKEGAFEMLGWLLETHPDLYGMLHIESAEVMVLDVTYSARLKDDNMVASVLAFMRNFSGQYIRKSKHSVLHKNTVYFGSERAKWLQRKLYGKATEFFEQLEEQRKLAKGKDKAAERVVAVMEDPRLQEWVRGLLRIETGMKKAWLTKLGIPTNLFELIKYQELNPNFLQELWLKANEDMFKALEGQTMKTTDHEIIKAKIHSVFDTYSKSGKLIKTKSRNLINFYRNLENYGYDAVKKECGKSQFYTYLTDLITCGFSKAYLQNLHVENKNNIIPFIKLVEIKFEEQTPDWYVEPVSTFRFKQIA
ncbi:DNA replication protein [Acinetobacter radioresistens]|uniref:phage/plasmid replication protein, II/X family n=1 Tax=Acinetobacter TaxID=469 RepID=UPI0002D7D062|nr:MULTISPECIES: phage/plasmid replication protein, II/X family [Acinetobacter]EXF55656.1 phage/plasmid replication family protein [Acinetobacter sp. 1294596]MCK4112534.1 DNA replication protein [Acinetobacter radioresistens]MCX0344053.1 phage/plasmid replication protein, II/X family [Acinetobacter radioresistens]